MEYLCSICGTTVIRGRYFCYKCYSEFKYDIMFKQPWTSFLQNEEKRRRRAPILVYIGETEEGTIWQVENVKGMN